MTIMRVAVSPMGARTRPQQKERTGMAIWAMLLVSVLMPLFMALAFLLGRYLGLRRPTVDRYSPVIRQHFDLLQGAELNEAAVEAAKERFQHLFEQDAASAVEASM